MPTMVAFERLAEPQHCGNRFKKNTNRFFLTMKLFQHIAYAAGCVLIGIGIGLGITRIKETHINKQARKIERETR